MTQILAILAGIIELVTAWFIKSPEQKLADAVQKQKDFNDKLSSAMEKAKNDKNPDDLSRLINSRDE